MELRFIERNGTHFLDVRWILKNTHFGVFRSLIWIPTFVSLKNISQYMLDPIIYYLKKN